MNAVKDFIIGAIYIAIELVALAMFAAFLLVMVGIYVGAFT